MANPWTLPQRWSSHRALRVAWVGLVSGAGTGVALLVLARSGMSALLGDAGFYLVMAGGGWLTGKALQRSLPLPQKDGLPLSAAFALAYAAGVDPLNALLVDLSLTGDWLFPALWLAIVTAALAGAIAWTGTRARSTTAVAALVGVGVMALIVLAVNLLVWLGLQQNAGGGPSALMLAGVWAVHLAPALWLPAVTHFRLKPALQTP